MVTGGSPGLVVTGGKVVCSNPSTSYWMDIFILSCCKNCHVSMKKTENKQNRGLGWLNGQLWGTAQSQAC